MAEAPPAEYRRLKLFYLLEGTGADVLTYILRSGTEAPTTPVHLDMYMSSLSLHSKANYCHLKGKEKRNIFNPSELKQIQKHPSWDNFDVTLLFKAISFACEDIARPADAKWKNQNEMEGLIKRIKDERNICVHEKELMNVADFQAKFNELEGILHKTLTAAKIRYNVPDNDFTPVRDKLLQDIGIMKKALTVKEILERDVRDVLPLFIEQSKIHLQGLYQQAQYFDPLSFLSGSPHKMNIQSIYCKAYLLDQREGSCTAVIDCLDLLNTEQLLGQSPQSLTSSQFFMISGVAGSGKTTLLTFFMSEWVKNTHNCRIKNLSEYDIVLRILCRENDGPSLQEFLLQALPNIFVGIKDRIVSLLKEVKVIFLIDGLDELSPGNSSDKLVTDILNIGKAVPGFTVICTSRPESVTDFLANVPDSYQKWKMEMQGISREQRTDFVLRYYNSFPPHSRKDSDRLKYVMECIGWKDHFGLPLNLLFVATLFYTEPNLVKETTTQTSLYLNIHEWCVQKLLHRLARHPQAGMDRLAREVSIRKVLKVLYHVALQDLLQGKLSLTDKDTRLLKECCMAENLPTPEVMGAFLCLREDVVMLVRRQKYFAQHKSLQEFFAARKIIENLEEDLSAGCIRRILQYPSQTQLVKLQNVLLHAAGLLSRPGVKLIPEAIQEVVDLLVETGMVLCNEWLFLLNDMEVNSIALEQVAKYVRSKGLQNEIVKISNSNITNATALLSLIPRTKIMIQFQRNETHMREFCRAAAGHICLRLALWHHYKQPYFPPASTFMLQDLPRSNLQWFVGHLSPDAIMLLQESQRLDYLHLAVSGDHDAPEILSALATTCPSLRRLSHLLLHVPVKAVTPDVLKTPLPDDLYVRLVLSGVEEELLEQTCLLAAALQPSKGYWRITFPDSRIKVFEWRRLINLLADAGVRVKAGIRVSTTIITTKQEINELNTLAMTKMLGGYERWSEDTLWRLWN